jgi:hypothetical protein
MRFVSPHSWLRLAPEAITRLVAPKSLMSPNPGAEGRPGDKVKVFVLHVEPMNDMADRSLKANAH